MVVVGCVSLGFMFAISMKKRVDELRQVERIINHIEGEIRYNNALIKEALRGARTRCAEPFDEWLNYVADELEEDYNDSFSHIWDRSLDILQRKTHLKKSDIKELVLIGQALGYLDMKAIKMGLELQKENLHNVILNLDEVLANNMKVSVILGTLGGFFLVVILL